MFVVVQHRITDPDKFFSMDPEEFERNSPSTAQGCQFYPSKDGSTAVCLWEADSVDSLRSYIDSATEGSAENSYFEVDAERSMGLPQAATAGA